MNDTASLAAPDCPADARSADVRTTGETVYDAVTVLALLVGGFVVPVAGWVAGIVLLWNGPRWTLAQRWTGTLAWPVTIALVLASVALPWRGSLWIGVGLAGPALVTLFVVLSRAAARGVRR